MTQARTKLLLLLIAALSVGMGPSARSQDAKSKDAQSTDTQSKIKHFKLAGTVTAVDAKQRKLTVQHGAIPGFMGAMTMAYPAGKGENLTKLAPGDHIQADVVVSDTDMRLENIKVTSPPKDSKSQK